jgi:molybdate transport system ATP-binding protein
VRLRVLARDVSITPEEHRHTSMQNHRPCRIEVAADDAHPSQVLLRLRIGEAAPLARITRRVFDSLGLQAWALVESVALVP